MKVALINAPGKEIKVEPLGLEYLASSLKANGFEVTLIDATIEGLSEVEYFHRIKKTKPDVIGIAMTTVSLKQDLRGLFLAKKACPDAKVIVGGPHPSAVPVELMKSVKDIDFAVIGEGEITIVELMRALEKRNANFNNINGIAFRDESGNIRLTKPRKLISNLDSIPIPTREFIDFKKVKPGIPFGRRKFYSIMMISRGCPYKCIYCSKPVFGRSYRYRSVENVLEEIEYLVSIGVREIRFHDDTFTMMPGHTVKLCEELIKRKFDLIWSCTTRADKISKELLKMMKKAGCYHIAYGVESGSQEILDKAKRSMKVDQIEKAFKITREVGLEASAFIIIGLPGETKETLKETLSLIKKIKPDFFNASLCGIFPKTELYEIAKQEGVIKEIDWCEYATSEGATNPLNIGPLPQYIPKDLTQEELEKAFKRFYLSYYSSLMTILRQLKLMRSPEILLKGIETFIKYISWRR